MFGLALSWLEPAAADVHDIAGPHLRGLGISGEPCHTRRYWIGKINDLLGVTRNPSMMKYSLLACPIACAISAWLLWKGNRALQVTEGRAR